MGEISPKSINLATKHPMNIHYCKRTVPVLEDLEKEVPDNSHTPFRIQQLQLYNPIYSKFFELTTNNYNKISLNHKYHFHSLSAVFSGETCERFKKETFIKFSPLLDPIKFMIGKYDVSDKRLSSMPTVDQVDECHPKYMDTNNASYVDGFFSYLTSQLLHHYQVTNAIDFYGSFLGIQEQFRACITDDVDYLRGSDFFNDHIGDLFILDEDSLKISPGELSDYLQMGSRRNRNKICFDSDAADETYQLQDILEITELSEVQGSEPEFDLDPAPDMVYETAKYIPNQNNQNNQNKNNASLSASSENTSNNSEINYSSDEDDGEEKEDSWETDEEEDKDDDDGDGDADADNKKIEEDDEIYAYIRNFPIQMICLEKCDGTMDKLLVHNKLKEDEAASALFQIIMTLIAYQKAFHFTHNDLHTNNIMYIETDQEFLEYQYKNKQYRVPTFGKIYKIIDFGRSIYQYQGHTFCSDSFAPGGDASTQYNCEPFMNPKKPRLDPNYSFDLCRLGCSIYDFLMDEEDEAKGDKALDEFQRTIKRWCTDDQGKNVLYKKNGEERYPNFKLYKMIARTVHNHSPEAQLEYDFFKQFLVKPGKKGAKNTKKSKSIIDLDAIPCFC